MMLVNFPALVTVYKGIHVHIIYHQIKVAVIIQIAVGRSVGERGSTQAGLIARVGKAEIPLVEKEFIGNRAGRHFIDDLIKLIFLTGHHHALDNIIGKEVNKILIGYIMVDPVTNKNIGAPVIIRIEYQSAPAPV